MSGYLRRLQRAMAELGLSRSPIHLMTSGGSLASLETAARFPVRLVESGPAGGAILAGRIALERGERRILSFDMGGTTAKICLIDDGEPLKARAFEVDRQSRFKKGSGTPVRIPVIEMVEIGAGGGSIARVDALQRILVGPDSAGAEPGPACYGRGGTEPTVTDADLAIGKIDPARFAGGKIAIDAGQGRGGAGGGDRGEARRHGGRAGRRRRRRDRRREHGQRRARACGGARRGASPSARWWPSAARRRCTPAGSPRSSASRASSCRRMRASARPSASWRRRRPTRSCARATCGSTAFDAEAANALIDGHAARGRDARRAAAGERPVSVKRSAFMRYAGQGHEITVALPDRPLAPADAATFRAEFEREYTRLFARHIPNAEIEIMSWVVLATTETEPPQRLASRRAARAPARRRRALRLRRAPRPPHRRAGVRARPALQPGTAHRGPGADRRGRHLHLRLAELRPRRRRRRRAGADSARPA